MLVLAQLKNAVFSSKTCSILTHNLYWARFMSVIPDTDTESFEA
jgi:hypothetical protein